MPDLLHIYWLSLCLRVAMLRLSHLPYENLVAASEQAQEAVVLCAPGRLGFDELDARHSRKHQKTAGPLQERVKNGQNQTQQQWYAMVCVGGHH